MNPENEVKVNNLELYSTYTLGKHIYSTEWTYSLFALFMSKFHEYTII